MANGVTSPIVDGVGYSVGVPPVPAPDAGFLGLLDFTGIPIGSVSAVVVVGDFGTLVYEGLEPTVVITSSTVVEPGTGTLTYEGLVPTMVTPNSVSPGTGNLVWEGLAPQPEVLAGIGTLTWEGFAPAMVRYGDCIRCDSTFITADSTAFSADLVSVCEYVWVQLGDTQTTWTETGSTSQPWTELTGVTGDWAEIGATTATWDESVTPQAGTWESAVKTRIGWQQLSPVPEADEGVDFVLKVNDQYPLIVADAHASYIINDIETP